MHLTDDERDLVLYGLSVVAKADDAKRADPHVTTKAKALAVRLGGDPDAAGFKPATVSSTDGDRRVVDRILSHALPWFVLVGLVPFILIVVIKGWHDAFEEGDAVIYLIGLSFAVAGEVWIELVDHGRQLLGQAATRREAARAAFTARTSGPIATFILAAAFYTPLLAVAALLGEDQGVFDFETTGGQCIALLVGVTLLALARFVALDPDDR